MTKTELFDAHVLAEVRPMVTNMPDHQYVAQTDGSARMRIAKFNDGRYRVKGVPGHTHNSTAICSIEADFSSKRANALTVNPSFSYVPEEKYEADEYITGDTENITDPRFDRAVEKCIGRIRLVPENCHNEIEEPGRSIAEVRTIVSSQNQLKSLTYVDEMGTMVYPENGRDATHEFVGTVPVYIMGLRGAYQASGVALNRYAETRVVLTNGDNELERVFALTADDAHFADTGAAWDGTREYSWDQDSKMYHTPAISVVLTVREVTPAVDSAATGATAAANTGDQDVLAAADTRIRIDFQAAYTTPPGARSCLINPNFDATDVRLANPIYPTNTTRIGVSAVVANQYQECREQYFNLDAVVNADTGQNYLRGGNARFGYFHGMPAARIPLGRPHVIYGGSRVSTSPYGGAQPVSVVTRVRGLHDTAKVTQLVSRLAGLTKTYAAGAVTLTEGGNAVALPAGLFQHRGDTYQTAAGLDYLHQAENFVTRNGPFARRMPDQYSMHSILPGTDACGGGSIFGSMQAALASNAIALGLVAAVAPNLSHDPNSALLQNVNAAGNVIASRFSVDDQAFRAVTDPLDTFPYTGRDLNDIFENTTDNLSPAMAFERLIFNNAATDNSNYRKLVGQTRIRALDDARTVPQPAYLSQVYSDVSQPYLTAAGGGGPQAYYDQFRANMQGNIERYAEARTDCLRRHASSRSLMSRVPLHIGFVHDRLTVNVHSYASISADAAGPVGSSKGRPCIINQALFTTASDAVDTAATAAAAPGAGAPEAAALAAARALLQQLKIYTFFGRVMNNRLVFLGGEAVPALSQFVYRIYDDNTSTYSIMVNAGGQRTITAAEFLRITGDAITSVAFNTFAQLQNYADAFDLPPERGYSLPFYNTEKARNQFISNLTVYGTGTHNPLTSALPFQAITDVSLFDNTTCTSEVSLQPLLNRLYSTTNSASSQDFGTEVNAKVNALTHIRAATDLHQYGYNRRGTAGDLALIGAGLGDQFHVARTLITLDGPGRIKIMNYAIAVNSKYPRYCYVIFGDIGRTALTNQMPTVLRFDMCSSELRMIQDNSGTSAAALANADLPDPYTMYTCAPVQRFDHATNSWANTLSAAQFAAIATNTPAGLPSGGNSRTHVLLQFDSFDFMQDIRDQFGFQPQIDQGFGLAFRSRMRVSEPMCAPILNPNVRIQSGPPLNFDTRHLPPEMRDFDLLLRDIDFSFLPQPGVNGQPWALTNLRSYEFAGGNQVQTAVDSLLYLPEFKEYKLPIRDLAFDHTIYTSNGMPSYIALFCRHLESKNALNYDVQQPLIATLNIACDTTKRKSNVVTDDLGKHHLFHLTMRNVHPASGYDSAAYNKRQVVLLAAEDIGLMSLRTADYQTLRRVRFQLSGTINSVGNLTVLFVYNNRGLEIRGADIKVVRV